MKISEKSTPPNVRNTHSSVRNMVQLFYSSSVHPVRFLFKISTIGQRMINGHQVSIMHTIIPLD
eukprot:COSAG02_NODE_2411_length_8920_cov_5.544496_8_plen_63_part_01